MTEEQEQVTRVLTVICHFPCGSDRVLSLTCIQMMTADNLVCHLYADTHFPYHPSLSRLLSATFQHRYSIASIQCVVILTNIQKQLQKMATKADLKVKPNVH